MGHLLSDHHIVFSGLSFYNPNNKQRVIEKRDIASINIDSFKTNILQSDLINVYKTLNLDDLVEAYDHELSQILDKHAPLKCRTVRAPKRDPWINDKVLQAKRNARSLERRWRNTGSDIDRRK